MVDNQTGKIVVGSDWFGNNIIYCSVPIRALFILNTLFVNFCRNIPFRIFENRDDKRNSNHDCQSDNKE